MMDGKAATLLQKPFSARALGVKIREILRYSGLQHKRIARPGSRSPRSDSLKNTFAKQRNAPRAIAAVA